MNSTGKRLLGVALVLVAVTMLLGVASVGFASSPAEQSLDRPDDPTTQETIGYVEGYWYDDDLPVDGEPGATVSDDELEEVVYRSMARVEVIRELPFQEEVSVEVIPRGEFQSDSDAVTGEPAPDERLHENVRLEALFMADRETEALAEHETLLGGSVAGYYDPASEEIVLVAESTDEPELDEITLGHELLHALQDQHFDLSGYDRETTDQDNAKNGLIEGDAVWVETQYEEYCAVSWECTIPSGGQQAQPPEINWGLYFTIFQPYDDGPEYVEALLNGDDDPDWEALNDAYDDPPASSSEVIRPGDEREPRSIEIEDRSSEAWTQLEIDGQVANDTVGEAGMVSMFAGDTIEGEESVIDADEMLTGGMLGTVEGIDYDHEYTDGWAGDELVTYVGENESVDDSGYVWQTEWTDEDEAEQFLEGYLAQLELENATAVEERQNTFEVDEEYPGAYYLEHDDETVTIVRAPSVSELPELEAGAAPSGEDTLEVESTLLEADGDRSTNGDSTDDADDTRGTTDGDEDDEVDDDSIPGLGIVVTLVALSLVLCFGLGARRRSNLSTRHTDE